MLVSKPNFMKFGWPYFSRPFQSSLTCQRMLLYASTWVILVYACLQAFALPNIAVNTDISELLQHLINSDHIPLCVLVHSRPTDDQLKKSLMRLWSANKGRSTEHFSSWKLVAVNTTQNQRLPGYLLLNSKVPESSMLRCFLGPTLSHDFKPSASFKIKHLQQWLNQMESQHWWLVNGNVDAIESSADNYRFTLVVFPTVQQHEELEQAVFQVREALFKECSINVIVFHSSSVYLRNVLEKYRVTKMPSVVLIEKGKGVGQQQSVFDIHDVTTGRMETDLRARLVPAPSLTMQDFESEVIRAKQSHEYVPYLIGFFAHWAKDNHVFLDFLHQTVEEFVSMDMNLRYGLVDAASNPMVVSHFMSSECLQHLPFLALLHREKGAASFNITELLVIHPSPYTVFLAMHEAGHVLTDRQHQPISYQPYGRNTKMCSMREGPDGDLCSADNTTWLFSSHFLMNFLKYPQNQEEAMTLPSDEESTAIPLASTEDWHYPFQFSDGDSHASSRVRFTVFIFVRHPCHSCERRMPHFEEFYRQLSLNESYTVRLVNCSQTAQVCEEHHVTGYPTILAFRWHDTPTLCAHHCSHPSDCHLSVRQDYHGVLTVPAIMDWIRSVSSPPFSTFRFEELSWIKRETAQLVAMVIPQQCGYLPLPPNKDRDYYFSTTCFRELCERLYSVVSCVTVNSPDIPPSEFDDVSSSSMVVAKVIFRRRDGIEVTLMRLGQSLASVLNEETDITLHMFHTHHSYNLHQKQKCEDDHGQCIQFLESFSRDHLRLPVTPLTSEILHSHNDFLFGHNTPVLLALVEDELAADFRKILEGVAYTLYKEVVVASLDVSMFPAWAGRLVPSTYNSLHSESVDWGELSVYPRLCMFYWQDHTKAAFYPPVSSVPLPSSHPLLDDTSADIERDSFLSGEMIMQFAERFLQDPASLLVETERF